MISTKKHLLTNIWLVACLFSLSLAMGCSEYPKVSTYAYELGTALYSTCNRSDAARLKRIAQLTEAARTEAQITDQEADWIHQIIKRAERGEWEVAVSESRLLLESQVVER